MWHFASQHLYLLSLLLLFKRTALIESHDCYSIIKMSIIQAGTGCGGMCLLSYHGVVGQRQTGFIGFITIY